MTMLRHHPPSLSDVRVYLNEGKYLASVFSVKADVRSVMGLPIQKVVPTQASTAGRCSLPSLECRVSHGANDSYFEIVGKSVASVRRALATPFNIPDDARPFIKGVQVGPDYRLRPGDQLEFVRRWGRKEALEPEDEARITRIEERLAMIETNLVRRKPGRKNSTAALAHFAEEQMRLGKTRKEIAQEWRRLHPDDNDITEETVRGAWRRHYGDKARKRRTK